MKLCVIFSIAVSLVMVNGDGHCPDETMECAKSTLLEGKCRSTWNVMQMFLNLWDYDNNCEITSMEKSNALQQFFDRQENYDGIICSSDFIDACMDYSLTYEFCQFRFRKMAGSEDCWYNKDDQSDEDVSSFYRQGLQDLVDFCREGNNNVKNRDCYGLAHLVEFNLYQVYIENQQDKQNPILEGFHAYGYTENTTANSKFEAVRKAIALISGNEDYVTYDEGVAFAKLLDADNNGCIKQDELAAYYFQNFQISYEFGEYLWEQTPDINGDGCKTPEETLNGNTQGYESYYVNAAYIGMLVNYCNKDEDRYETLNECYNIQDYCSSPWFNMLFECADNVKDCGWGSYGDCVMKLDMCESDSGTIMEISRINNRRSDYCTPSSTYDDDYYGVATATTPLAPIYLVLSVALFLSVFF